MLGRSVTYIDVCMGVCIGWLLFVFADLAKRLLVSVESCNVRNSSQDVLSVEI